MKRSKIIVLLLISILIYSTANGQTKKFGIGVIMGEPTGLSAKLWVSNNQAVVFGLGWSFNGYRFNGFDYDYDKGTRTHLHIDYIWHSFNALGSNGQFPLFYGVGARIITGPEYSGTLGIRGVLGIAWLPRSTPLDIFIEVVPTLFLVRSSGLGVDTGIGARVFL